MYNLLHLSFLAYKTPYSVFRNASFLNRCILNSILCGLNYNFLRGEEEEKGEGGRGEKKEEENWKQSEGRMENVSSIYFSLKIPGEFRKCVVINSRHFSKKLLTTEPFSPLRHRSRWFNSVCLFPYIPDDFSIYPTASQVNFEGTESASNSRFVLRLKLSVFIILADLAYFG